MSNTKIISRYVTKSGTKNLEDMTREELIEAVRNLGGMLKDMFENRQHERRVLETFRRPMENASHGANTE